MPASYRQNCSMQVRGQALARPVLASIVAGTAAKQNGSPYAACADSPLSLVPAGGEAMTAHPHVDSNTGRLISFSYRVGPSIRTPFLGTSLTFYEFTEGQLSSISSPPAVHPVC